MSKETKSSVFIYNGFCDLRLPFDGRNFDFPQGKTTKVDDLYCWAPDEYKRGHESDPDPTAILERTYPARRFAEELLLNRHGLNLVVEGAVWLGDREPNEKEKALADKHGQRLRRAKVEASLAEHRGALQKGATHELDAQIVIWMEELGIHDPYLNPAPQVDLNQAFAQFLQQAAQQQAPQPQPAGARR